MRARRSLPVPPRPDARPEGARALRPRIRRQSRPNRARTPGRRTRARTPETLEVAVRIGERPAGDGIRAEGQNDQGNRGGLHARALGHEGHDLRSRAAPRPEHHGHRLNGEGEEPAHVRDGVLDQREQLSLVEAGPDQVPGRPRRGLFQRDFRRARPGRHDHDFLVEIEHGVDGSSSLARLPHDENQPLRIARRALGVGDDADQDAGELRQIDPAHDPRSGRGLSRRTC